MVPQASMLQSALMKVNNALAFTILTNGVSTVQGRLVDSNRNLAAKVLLLLGQLAQAMGPAFDRQGRFLLNPALLCLSDNKHQVSCSHKSRPDMNGLCLASGNPLLSTMPNLQRSVSNTFV